MPGKRGILSLRGVPVPPGDHLQPIPLFQSFLRRGEIEAQTTPGNRNSGLCVEAIHGILRFMQWREQRTRESFVWVSLSCTYLMLSSIYSVVCESVFQSLYKCLRHIRPAEVRRQGF